MQTNNFFREYADMIAEAELAGKLSEPLVLKSIQTEPDEKPAPSNTSKADMEPTPATSTDKDKASSGNEPTTQPTGPNAPKIEKPLDELGNGTGVAPAQPGAAAAPNRRTTTGTPGEGPMNSTVGVHPGDKNRVTVAPNMQQSVLDYEKKQQAIDQANSIYRQNQHPDAQGLGQKVGDFIGQGVAGVRSAWDSGVNAYKQAVNPIPDPDRPVDVIPNPARGTATPRESVNYQLRRLSDIVAEAEQFKGVTNQGTKSKDMMKPYKG